VVEDVIVKKFTFTISSPDELLAENKQVYEVSKQFSLYAKRTMQFLDQNYLLLTHTALLQN